MKMQIINCLFELIKTNFGEDKWREILKRSGLNNLETYRKYVKGMDIDDDKAMEVVMVTTEILGITLEQAAEAFGEYWVCTYAPRFYGNIYKRFKNIREFIEGMDEVHQEVTQLIPNSKPPRFEIEVIDDKSIKVHYKSERDMIAFYVGLVKGLSKYFNTAVEVKKLSKEFVEIKFS